MSSAPGRRLPDFFIAGAQKAGTTALWEYLRAHPQVFMPDVKEPHFFARDLEAPRHIRDSERYLQLFADAGDALRVGEASGGYLFSETAASEIREFCGPVDVVIMLRNPVDAMYAHHSQLLANGSETIADFGKALAAEPDRREGRRIPEGVAPPQALWYRAKVRYAAMVERYLEVFGRERVHFVLYDDFRHTTADAYRGVLEFLGVDPSFRPPLDVVNPNRRLRSVRLRRLLRDPPGWVRKVGRLLLPSPARRRKLVDALVELNASVGSRPAMDPELRSRLLDELAPEIDRLGELIGRDLSGWYRGEES